MSRREKGISLVLVSLIGTGLLVMTAIAGDVGMVLYTKHRMQTAADAAALAGARVLFFEGRGAAIQQAQALTNLNGYQIADTAVTFPAGETEVAVQFQSPQGLVLGTILTDTSVDVPVKAVAHRFIRRYGLRPFGMPEDPYVEEQVYTLKQSTGGVTSGNFQGLDLDVPGAKGFGLGIQFGARNMYNVGDLVPTETGNIAGPTKAAVQAVIDSGEARIVVPLIEKQTYLDANGKTLVKIVALSIWDLVGMDGTAVQARFIRQLALNEFPGTITASRLVE